MWTIPFPQLIMSKYYITLRIKVDFDFKSDRTEGVDVVTKRNKTISSRVGTTIIQYFIE